MPFTYAPDFLNIIIIIVLVDGSYNENSLKFTLVDFGFDLVFCVHSAHSPSLSSLVLSVSDSCKRKIH